MVHKHFTLASHSHYIVLVRSLCQTDLNPQRTAHSGRTKMTNKTTKRGFANRGHQDAFRKPVYRNIHALLCASAASLALCSSVIHADDSSARGRPTRTPIKHLVVIFNENHTFDNYFGTYPNAANIPGEQGFIGVPAPEFHARPDTPQANG